MLLKIQVALLDTVFKPLWFHTQNKMQTSTGYGKNLKTEYMIKYNNRLYRVYNCIFSNTGTFYIKTKTGDVIVDIN